MGGRHLLRHAKEVAGAPPLDEILLRLAPRNVHRTGRQDSRIRRGH